jgi:hypothetical protein
MAQDEPKVISIRLMNGRLHLEGKLVSIALREYLARNAPLTQLSPLGAKTPRAGRTKVRDRHPRGSRSR